ncbi:MAG: thiamine diphosphokinase [Synergistaceae bacterium]|jgi:thiamine pyrophosphokinase|nr:thiamine diphosphokinase [Synergistaceae bacterium]
MSMNAARMAVSRDVEVFYRFSRRTCGLFAGGSTLFLLGGRPPEPEWASELALRNSARVWAVDSGASACRAAGLVPSVLVGDRDSAPPGDWEWAASAGAKENIYDRNKDKTDFQLAMSLFKGEIERDDRFRPPALIVSGCFGGAFDHQTSTFYTLASSGGDFFRCMIDETEGVVFVYPGDWAALEFSGLPKAVSLLPATDLCRGVSVSGVKWPLVRATLERAFPWAVSNEANDPGEPVAAACEEGILALYWRFY